MVVVDDPTNHKSNIYLYDLARGMGEPKKSLNHTRLGNDFRIAVDETSRLLALYSSAEVPTHSWLRRHNAYSDRSHLSFSNSTSGLLSSSKEAQR